MVTIAVAALDGGEVSIDEAALEALISELRGPALRRGEPGYDEACTLYNAMIDHKPAIAQYRGQRPQIVDRKSLRNTKNGLFPSPFRFRPYGQCGKWVSEIFPRTGELVDDICFIHSLPRRCTSSFERRSVCVAMPHWKPNGSCTFPMRSPQKQSMMGATSVQPQSTACFIAASTSSTYR